MRSDDDALVMVMCCIWRFTCLHCRCPPRLPPPIGALALFLLIRSNITRVRAAVRSNVHYCKTRDVVEEKARPKADVRRESRERNESQQ